MGVEIELKLTLGPKRLEKLLQAPALADHATDAPQSRRLVSTYYDTPDHALASQGVALRVRGIDDGFVQTVKRRGQQHYQRGEWETHLASAQPDLDAVADPDTAVLLASVADRLTEVFTTDFERETRLVRLETGSEIEVAVDRGEIRAGPSTTPIHEVELELKTGRTSDLFELARGLHRHATFRLDTRTKASRGYALIAPESPRPVKAKLPGLDPEMTVEAAFKAIAQSCISHMRSNERCVLLDAHPGGVHQMRVGARRLRSAVSLFRTALPKRRAKRVQKGLRWFANELADARTWDVLRNETLAPLRERMPEDEALVQLAHAAQTARNHGYARAHDAVESPRYTRLLLDLGSWLEDDEWESDHDGGALRRPVAKLAAETLDERYRMAKKAEHGWRRMEPNELHELRIEIKKLRYAAQFFGSLYPDRHAAEFASAAGQLQDILGHVQDVADTPVVLVALPGADTPALTRAIGIVAGWQAAAEQAARASLPLAWQRFMELDRFWK